ncbi:hypothetical protein [Mesorhizobium qingshengii]|jgi:hypothetical protein|uniref:hypothetical protein n=1 Tax=Mesorhizobium qingshengii TaxID=1165689 RepID=UPI00115F7E47|nr:hypothetical protein [Mesorhizobium qingshengii]
MGEILTLERDPERSSDEITLTKERSSFRFPRNGSYAEHQSSHAAESGLISAVCEAIFKPGVMKGPVFNRAVERDYLPLLALPL